MRRRLRHDAIPSAPTSCAPPKRQGARDSSNLRTSANCSWLSRPSLAEGSGSMLERDRAAPPNDLHANTMSSPVEVLLALNASCLDCWDQTPPPSAILGIPPPPLPLFLQRAFNAVDADAVDADLCTIQCDWNTNVGVGNVEYVELPRQVVTGPVLDDTWLLVLVGTCLGILLLAVLLALFLLKSRIESSGKGGVLKLDVPTLHGKSNKGVGVGKPCETVLYPCSSSHNATTPDSRILWAALTPRGTTQHFTTEPPSTHRQITQSDITHPTSLPIATGQLIDIPSFDNSGFVDSDDPTYAEPLTPIYCEPMLVLGEGFVEPSTQGLGTMKRCATLRPTVSSPTRIEHPNFTPLNMLHQQHSNHRSLRRSTLSRKEADAVVL